MQYEYPSLSQVDPSYHPMHLYPAPRQMDSSYIPNTSEELLDEELRDPDKSEALFSMYLDRSDEDDRKTTERWKGESDAILIFTGLFSAALAALISVSIQGLQPGSQDKSDFYLGNIYHLLANSTTSQPIVHPTPSDPPKFSPTKSAVLVNSLWFLSLVMSLTGALIAVFIQQWAQSYLQATQERHSPKFRARIRTFHAEALDKLYFHRITRAVPILIHLSLFLFFAGLPIFLFNINRTVFNVVVAWLALCVAGYACITLMPIIRQDSPYYSPLSSSIWWCVANTPFLFFRILRNFMPHNHVVQWYHAHYAKSHFRWPSLHAMRRAAERFARKLSSDIDYRALLWMFKTLNDDDEFEQFFDALPGLCDSEELVDAQKAFIKPNEKALSRALIGMMDRTLLSELVPESVKQRRIIICTKVIGATFLLEPWWTLPRVLFGDWIGFSRSIHFGLLVQGWKKKIDPVIAFYGQFVVAVTLASVQQRDERWFELASGQLNESKSYLRSYYANGDSILLANAIFIIRRTVQTFSGLENRHQGDIRALEASSKTLELVCRFDIQNTQEEHQHVFCSLWNQLVDEAQINPDPHITSICVMMLRRIRRLYVTLHRNLPTQHGNFPTRHGNPTTLHGNTHLSTHETPRTRLAASTPFNSVPADPAVAEVPNEAMSYPRCNVYEHRPFTPVPRLPLNGLRINTNTRHVSMDKIRELTSYLVPVLPPTHSTPYGPPVLPGQYPLVSDPYSDSASHAPPVPRVTFGRARPHGRSGHSRDVSGTTAEAASRSNSRSPSPASPVYPDSELSFPARQRVPTITILNPSSDDPTTPFIQPPVMPGTPTAPPLPPPASAAGSTTTSSVRRVIPSTPYERMPSPRPSLSVEAPSLNSVHSGIPVQVPTTASPRTPTQTVPMSTAPSIASRSRSFFSSLTGRGSTSVPSSAVRRGGPAQTPSAVPPVIRFSGYGEFSGLSYYSPHSVRYETNLYPTALHLFEARKFLPHRPDLADRVRQCERVEQVPSISAELADFIRRDWDNVMLSIMDEVLYLKFRKHTGLRTLLFNTYPAELVYVESRDSFWGGDGEGAGTNELGKSLMRVRERLRIEGGERSINV